MKDDPELMTKFVKIVEQFPEIYDPNSKAYKTQQAEISWDSIAAILKDELDVEWTVDDLKVKWKGIRSSYNRYKSKLIDNSMRNPVSTPFKKYYLYDALKFIDPFTKPKGSPSYRKIHTEIGMNDEYLRTYGDIDVLPNEYNPIYTWRQTDVKSDLSNDNDLHSSRIDNITANNTRESITLDNLRKNKIERDLDDDNEDLQFFKSILPDIKDFSNQEKRKLKMGVLKLIDDLENERKRVKMK